MPTKIEWTEETWNPVTGCTPLSPGCANCYARRMAKRLAGRCGYPEAPHEFDVTLHPDRLDQPLRWKKPRKVFVCSMSDLFHEAVSFEYISRVFDVMGTFCRNTFQVLTKRPERMLEYVKWETKNTGEGYLNCGNVWMGVTICTPEELWKVDEMRMVQAPVRFVSFEPLLGDLGRIDLTGIHWAICGGETGPGARPMHPDWVRNLRDQCLKARIPFFFKSWGAWSRDRMLPNAKVHEFDRASDLFTKMYRVGKKRSGRLLDGREWSEYPRDSHNAISAAW